jgi:hypothetical protein
VFYLGYLRAELVRRKGRTILTMLGLALGGGTQVDPGPGGLGGRGGGAFAKCLPKRMQKFRSPRWGSACANWPR